MDGLGQEEWRTKVFKSRFFHRASRCEPSLRRLILIRSECASSWGESCRLGPSPRRTVHLGKAHKTWMENTHQVRPDNECASCAVQASSICPALPQHARCAVQN